MKQKSIWKAISVTSAALCLSACFPSRNISPPAEETPDILEVLVTEVVNDNLTLEPSESSDSLFGLAQERETITISYVRPRDMETESLPLLSLTLVNHSDRPLHELEISSQGTLSLQRDGLEKGTEPLNQMRHERLDSKQTLTITGHHQKAPVTLLNPSP
jgi:hypothetical protein